jgi:hypothetical protein
MKSKCFYNQNKAMSDKQITPQWAVHLAKGAANVYPNDPVIAQLKRFIEQVALHPSESAGVKGAVWVYTAKGLPKDGTIVLCEYKSGDLSHMEYLDCNKDWWLRNIHRWLNESPTAAGDGKEEKAFARWLAENTQTVWESNIPLYRYCDKNNEWGNYTIDDIYTEYKDL